MNPSDVEAPLVQRYGASTRSRILANGPLARSLGLALIAVAGTQAISLSARALLGKPPDAVTFAMGCLIPFLITVPMALYVFRQTEKLASAHKALLLAHARLMRKATHDHMTGLLNRESFLDLAMVVHAMPGKGTLLIIDVDHFKRVNDSHGHQTGDDALIHVAQIIARWAAKTDIAGRIGGEEFGVFLAGKSEAEALRAAQQLRAAVEERNIISRAGRIVGLTISVGGASSDESQSFSELMALADERLYTAKSIGRNRVVINAGLMLAAPAA